MEGPETFKEGALQKRSSGARFYGLFRIWQKRYFVLKDGQLQWYTNAKLTTRRGGFFVSSMCAIKVGISGKSDVVRFKT